MITNFSTSSIRTGVKRKRFWDQSAVANSFFSIATVTVGAGGAANVEFTSIPQTYTHLQIRGLARATNATTDYNVHAQFNTDTGNNYSYHFVYGNGSAAASGAGTTQPETLIGRITGANSTSGMFGVLVADILDYKDTNKYKTVRSLAGHDQNGSGSAWLMSSNWRSTAAITSIKIYPPAGNFAQYSSFSLYGVLA